MPLMGQPEVYIQFKGNNLDAEGHIHDESLQKFLKGFVEQFVAWIEKQK